MSRLRLGVIGAGAWGKNHVRTAATLADAELVAVCDADAKVRDRVARQFPAVKVTGDVAELLGLVDAVIVAAPAKAHAELARRAIEAGKPCLVEKPFALAVRLFGNMTAGHFVILSMFGIIFLFGTIPVWNSAIGFTTALLVTGILLLELIVALLQAYVFTLLSAVFIGLMQHEH